MVGINLPQGTTASSVFQALLAAAAEDHSVLASVLDGITKGNFGERLIEFEALRAGLAAPGRVDVAEALTRLSSERLVYVRTGESEVPLSEYLAGRADPLAVTTMSLGTSPGVTPRISYDGRIFTRDEIVGLAHDFLQRNTMTRAAGDALSWVSRQSILDLRGQKFVMMGAGAELAPTEILLRAGAAVLFLDLSSAEKYVADRSIQSGTVVYVPGGANLLTQPLEIAATIEAFAEGKPVHIGAYAYVGGKAMEWRLTAAMNGIIRRLDPAIVGSIGLYVSPTSPAEAQSEDATVSLGGYANPSLADRFWKGIGVLKPNLHEREDTFWPRDVVSLQGSSYLAAQYIEKRLAAEVFAARGVRPSERHLSRFAPAKPVASPQTQGEIFSPRTPHRVTSPQNAENLHRKNLVTVSANVAGITQTRSMQIPTFQAGFLGAPLLGLETYLPETTRWLSGLLYLQGILDAQAVGSARNPFEDENERVRRLSSVQVHGAVYSHPYAVEGAITRAALIGLRKRPRLIPGFVRSLMGK